MAKKGPTAINEPAKIGFFNIPIASFFTLSTFLFVFFTYVSSGFLTIKINESNPEINGPRNLTKWNAAIHRLCNVSNIIQWRILQSRHLGIIPIPPRTAAINAF